ncbi:MAG: hypothetical protein R2838_14935 [Caldilineaceae bacterium]
MITLAALETAVPSAQQQRAAALVMTTAGWTFDITGWMAAALWDKAQTALTPGRALTPPRAGWCALPRSGRGHPQAEVAIEALFAAGDGETASAQTLRRLDGLRAEQDAVRSTVEQIIERQVGGELARRGLGFAGASFPPVQFTFVEPPKKLVVSPRDRIATVHYRMLQPAFNTADAEATEATIAANFDLSAYVTRIGGLGAYPSMVIDRGDIPDHEHGGDGPNYLTLFPLGLSYNRSPQLTTINETVAEIVGNEVETAVVARYYPEFARKRKRMRHRLPGRRYAARGRPAAQRADAFDFRTEMRRTRLMVDRPAGRRSRRGRRLHGAAAATVCGQRLPHPQTQSSLFRLPGSYGTSAAGTDPLVPLLFPVSDQRRGHPPSCARCVA